MFDRDSLPWFVVFAAFLLVILGMAGWTNSFVHRNIGAINEQQEQAYTEYLQARADGYTVMLDDHEATVSELDVIGNNFTSYMIGYDHDGKVVSVTKRVDSASRGRSKSVISHTTIFTLRM